MDQSSSLLPPWTKPDHGQSSAHLSIQCIKNLASIEQAFCKASSMIIEFFRQEEWTYSHVGVALPEGKFIGKSIFKGDDIQKLEQHIREVTIGRKDNSLELTLRLSNTAVTDPWKKFTILLAKLQGLNRIYQEWIPCKQRALDMLKLHDVVAFRFENIQDELESAGYHDLIESLMEKLRILARFDVIYNRQTGSMDETEPIYTVHEMRRRKIGTRSTAKNNEGLQIHTITPPESGRPAVTSYQQPDRKIPGLVAVVLITVFVSIIPLILAWKIFAPSPGTVSDIDFYLLIQNSIMQLLGLFTAIFPIAKRPSSSAWTWAQLFTITGVLCSVAAVPMYLYLPTMWSALVSFIGSASQIALTLELSLIVDTPIGVYTHDKLP